MGAEVWLCGPPTLIPPEFERYGALITYNLREAVSGADVIMLLRCQKERQNEVFYPTDKEYFSLYGMNESRLGWAARDAIVMHPGPINRGVEIAPELADSEHSVILYQVSNGVAVRMAVLYLLLGTSEGEES
jgi:aspartate carbamoyltransferase catalytic subunit